jgi:hypothetical protein
MSIETARALAVARNEYQALAGNAEALERQLAETDLGKQLAEIKAMLVLSKAALAIAESEHRTAMLVEFQETGTKKVAGGIVKEYTDTVYVYDLEEARQYCLKDLPGALKLDKSFFEKHAKGVAETAPLSFVQIVEEHSYKPNVSSDLSSYLCETEAEQLAG